MGDWPQLSASCVKCRDLVFLSPWSGQVRRFGAGPPASRRFPNRASCARCVMLLKSDVDAWIRKGRGVLWGLVLAAGVDHGVE